MQGTRSLWEFDSNHAIPEAEVLPNDQAHSFVHKPINYTDHADHGAHGNHSFHKQADFIPHRSSSRNRHYPGLNRTEISPPDPPPSVVGSDKEPGSAASAQGTQHVERLHCSLCYVAVFWVLAAIFVGTLLTMTECALSELC